MAVQRIALYEALVAPMHLRVSDDAEGMTLDLEWPDMAHQPPPSLAVTELLFFVTLARMGTREPLRPLWLSTPEPPSPAAAYSEFLGVDIRPGPRHQIGFSFEDARRPFLTTNESLWESFEPRPPPRLAGCGAGGAAPVLRVYRESAWSWVVRAEAVQRSLRPGSGRWAG